MGLCHEPALSCCCCCGGAGSAGRCAGMRAGGCLRCRLAAARLLLHHLPAAAVGRFVHCVLMLLLKRWVHAGHACLAAAACCCAVGKLRWPASDHEVTCT
jgi:hypothetical protein